MKVAKANQADEASLGLAIEAMRADRLLCHSLMRQGRLGDAEAEAKRALELDPDLAHIHEDLVSIQAMKGDFTQAVECFRTAIRLNPGSALAHKKLGQALAAMGEAQQANTHFDAFLERDEDAGQVAVGAEHLKAGRVDDAIATLSQVLRKSPNNVDAMRFLAVAYW